jgi:tetratricopeptide (TPR) repeat protein
LKASNYITILVALFCIGTAAESYAKPNRKTTELTTSFSIDTLTAEQEQQFLYYFYETERLLLCNQIEEARPLVEFCYALNPYNATINNLMGHYAQSDQDFLMMLVYYKRAFELSPNEYWYNYNALLMQTETKKSQLEVISNLEPIAQNDPKNGDLYAFLQKVYISCEMYAKALAIQDPIDSINGYNEQSATQRYQLYLALNDYAGALREVERYIHLDDSNLNFLNLRVQLYEYTNQPYSKKVVAYEALLPYDHRNMLVLNNLAWALCMSGGDLERAEQLSQITIMTEPNNPIYLDTYAWIAYKLGDCETARFFIQRAIQYIDKDTSKEIKAHYKEIIRKCDK